MKKILSMITAMSIMCGCMLTAAHAEDGLIVSADFESGEAGFSARGTASVAATAEDAHSGTSSLIVEGRGGDAWNGASRGLSGIKLDENYKAVAYVKAVEPGDSFEVKMTLEMKDFSGTTYPQIGSATVNSDTWTAIEGTWKADYTGNIEILNLNLETSDDGIGKSFYADDVFFAQAGVKQPQIEEPAAQKTVTYSGIELADDVVGTKYEKQIEIMQALGVMDGYPDGTFKPENKVTRAEFLTMLLRLIKRQDVQSTTDSFTDVPADHFANGYIGYAVSAGICDGYGDGLFGPDDTVTYAQAVKMLMSTMGYDTVAQSNGGYPSGYIAAAGQQDIGVSGYGNDDPMDRGAVTALFETAIDAPLYMIDYGNKNTLYLDKNANILSEYYDGIYEKGYVVSSNTSTVSNGTTGLDIVDINGSDFRLGNTRANELVGYYVKYIAVQPDKGDDPTLLYIAVNSSRNDELTIKAEDIEEYADYQYEYYATEERTRTKKIKLEQDFNLIYNGKSVTTGYSDELMKPVLGEVKLIANDSGNYSTVVVTSYDIYVVSAVNRGLKTIYSKNNDSLKLDYDAGDINISISDKNGKELTFSSIAEDDVVQAASSLDGEEINVIVTSNKAEGIIKRTGDEEIDIDGSVYNVSDYFNDNYSMPELGKNVTAYLDMNNNVVYIGEGTTSGMTAGFINKCFVDEGADDYTVRIFSENGKFIDYVLATNVNIDGTKYSSEDAAEELISHINASDGSNVSIAKNRIILYSANSDKKITRIDTAVNTTDGDDTLKPGIDITKDEKFSYKQSTGTFYNNTENHFFSISDEAIVFSVPDDLGDTSDYEIKTKSSFGWQDYEIYPFKAGSSSLLTGYAVEFSSSSNSVSNEGYVITKVLDGLNAAGDESKILELYNGSTYKYTLKDSDLWKSEWGKGTIVKICINSSGEISAIEEAKTSGEIISDYDYSGKGYIYQREGNWGYFSASKPGSSADLSDMVLIPLNKFSIVVYNKRSEESYTGTVGDIVDYVSDPANCTEIFITMNYENPKQMICIVDY